MTARKRSEDEVLDINSLSRFTIPKLKKSKTELFENLSLEGREYLHEVLPTIEKNFKDRNVSKSFKFVTARITHNAQLLSAYLEKRKELKQEGYSEKETQDSYAFLCVNNEAELRKICENGVTVGNSAMSVLGNPEMAVCLCKHPDISRPTTFNPGEMAHLIIFKIIRGKVKIMVENRGGMHLDPTPFFDCHISKNATSIDLATTSHQAAYESTQIYLYEYGDLGVEDRPRQILPSSVITFRYVGDAKSVRPLLSKQVSSKASSSKSLPRISTLTASTTRTNHRPPPSSSVPKHPPQPPGPDQGTPGGTVTTPGAASVTRSISLPDTRPSSRGKPDPHSRPSSRASSTDTAAATSPAGDIVDAAPAAVRQPSPPAPGSVGREVSPEGLGPPGVVVWGGYLSSHGRRTCAVEMVVYGEQTLKPARIGPELSLCRRLSLSCSRSRYFPGVTSVPRTGEVCAGGRYYSYGEIRPGTHDSKPATRDKPATHSRDGQARFNQLLAYLTRKNSVVVAQLEGSVEVVVLTNCDLSHSLGLSEPHQPPTVLHCVFISQLSRSYALLGKENISHKPASPNPFESRPVPSPSALIRFTPPVCSPTPSQGGSDRSATRINKDCLKEAFNQQHKAGGPFVPADFGPPSVGSQHSGDSWSLPPSPSVFSSPSPGGGAGGVIHNVDDLHPSTTPLFKEPPHPTRLGAEVDGEVDYDEGFQRYVPVDSLVYKKTLIKAFNEQVSMQDKRNIEMARNRKFAGVMGANMGPPSHRPSSRSGEGSPASVGSVPRRRTPSQDSGSVGSALSPMVASSSPYPSPLRDTGTSPQTQTPPRTHIIGPHGQHIEPISPAGSGSGSLEPVSPASPFTVPPPPIYDASDQQAQLLQQQLHQKMSPMKASAKKPYPAQHSPSMVGSPYAHPPPSEAPLPAYHGPGTSAPPNQPYTQVHRGLVHADMGNIPGNVAKKPLLPTPGPDQLVRPPGGLLPHPGTPQQPHHLHHHHAQSPLQALQGLNQSPHHQQHQQPPSPHTQTSGLRVSDPRLLRRQGSSTSVTNTSILENILSVSPVQGLVSQAPGGQSTVQAAPTFPPPQRDPRLGMPGPSQVALTSTTTATMMPNFLDAGQNLPKSLSVGTTMLTTPPRSVAAACGKTSEPSPTVVSSAMSAAPSQSSSSSNSTSSINNAMLSLLQTLAGNSTGNSSSSSSSTSQKPPPTTQTLPTRLPAQPGEEPSKLCRTEGLTADTTTSAAPRQSLDQSPKDRPYDPFDDDNLPYEPQEEAPYDPSDSIVKKTQKDPEPEARFSSEDEDDGDEEDEDEKLEAIVKQPSLATVADLKEDFDGILGKPASSSSRQAGEDLALSEDLVNLIVKSQPLAAKAARELEEQIRDITVQSKKVEERIKASAPEIPSDQPSTEPGTKASRHSTQERTSQDNTRRSGESEPDRKAASSKTKGSKENSSDPHRRDRTDSSGPPTNHTPRKSTDQSSSVRPSQKSSLVLSPTEEGVPGANPPTSAIREIPVDLQDTNGHTHDVVSEQRQSLEYCSKVYTGASNNDLLALGLDYVPLRFLGGARVSKSGDVDLTVTMDPRRQRGGADTTETTGQAMGHDDAILDSVMKVLHSGRPSSPETKEDRDRSLLWHVALHYLLPLIEEPDRDSRVVLEDKSDAENSGDQRGGGDSRSGQVAVSGRDRGHCVLCQCCVCRCKAPLALLSNHVYLRDIHPIKVDTVWLHKRSKPCAKCREVLVSRNVATCGSNHWWTDPAKNTKQFPILTIWVKHSQVKRHAGGVSIMEDSEVDLLRQCLSVHGHALEHGFSDGTQVLPSLDKPVGRFPLFPQDFKCIEGENNVLSEQRTDKINTTIALPPKKRYKSAFDLGSKSNKDLKAIQRQIKGRKRCASETDARAKHHEAKKTLMSSEKLDTPSEPSVSKLKDHEPTDKTTNQHTKNTELIMSTSWTSAKAKFKDIKFMKERKAESQDKHLSVIPPKTDLQKTDVTAKGVCPASSGTKPTVAKLVKHRSIDGKRTGQAKKTDSTVRIQTKKPDTASKVRQPSGSKSEKADANIHKYRIPIKKPDTASIECQPAGSKAEHTPKADSTIHKYRIPIKKPDAVSKDSQPSVLISELPEKTDSAIHKYRIPIKKPDTASKDGKPSVSKSDLIEKADSNIRKYRIPIKKPDTASEDSQPSGPKAGQVSQKACNVLPTAMKRINTPSKGQELKPMKPLDKSASKDQPTGAKTKQVTHTASKSTISKKKNHSPVKRLVLKHLSSKTNSLSPSLSPSKKLMKTLSPGKKGQAALMISDKDSRVNARTALASKSMISNKKKSSPVKKLGHSHLTETQSSPPSNKKVLKALSLQQDVQKVILISDSDSSVDVMSLQSEDSASETISSEGKIVKRKKPVMFKLSSNRSPSLASKNVFEKTNSSDPKGPKSFQKAPRDVDKENKDGEAVTSKKKDTCKTRDSKLSEKDNSEDISKSVKFDSQSKKISKAHGVFQKKDIKLILCESRKSLAVSNVETQKAIQRVEEKDQASASDKDIPSKQQDKTEDSEKTTGDDTMYLDGIDDCRASPMQIPSLITGISVMSSRAAQVVPLVPTQNSPQYNHRIPTPYLPATPPVPLAHLTGFYRSPVNPNFQPNTPPWLRPRFGHPPPPLPPPHWHHNMHASAVYNQQYPYNPAVHVQQLVQYNQYGNQPHIGPPGLHHLYNTGPYQSSQLATNSMVQGHYSQATPQSYYPSNVVPTASEPYLVQQGHARAPEPPPLPPCEISPPLPPGENSPPLPPGETAPPLPPGEIAPPLPQDESSPPLPPDVIHPPLPTDEISPPLPTDEISPPLPTDEISPPLPTDVVRPPLPPDEIPLPIDEAIPPLPSAETLPPDTIPHSLPLDEVHPPKLPDDISSEKSPDETSSPSLSKEMSTPLSQNETAHSPPTSKSQPMVEPSESSSPLVPQAALESTLPTPEACPTTTSTIFPDSSRGAENLLPPEDVSKATPHILEFPSAEGSPKLDKSSLKSHQNRSEATDDISSSPSKTQESLTSQNITSYKNTSLTNSPGVPSQSSSLENAQMLPSIQNAPALSKLANSKPLPTDISCSVTPAEKEREQLPVSVRNPPLQPFPKTTQKASATNLLGIQVTSSFKRNKLTVEDLESLESMKAIGCIDDDELSQEEQLLPLLCELPISDEEYMDNDPPPTTVKKVEAVSNNIDSRTNESNSNKEIPSNLVTYASSDAEENENDSSDDKRARLYSEKSEVNVESSTDTNDDYVSKEAMITEKSFCEEMMDDLKRNAEKHSGTKATSVISGSSGNNECDGESSDVDEVLENIQNVIDKLKHVFDLEDDDLSVSGGKDTSMISGTADDKIDLNCTGGTLVHYSCSEDEDENKKKRKDKADDSSLDDSLLSAASELSESKADSPLWKTIKNLKHLLESEVGSESAAESVSSSHREHAKKPKSPLWHAVHNLRLMLNTKSDGKQHKDVKTESKKHRPSTVFVEPNFAKNSPQQPQEAYCSLKIDPDTTWSDVLDSEREDPRHSSSEKPLDAIRLKGKSILEIIPEYSTSSPYRQSRKTPIIPLSPIRCPSEREQIDKELEDAEERKNLIKPGSEEDDSSSSGSSCGSDCSCSSCSSSENDESDDEDSNVDRSDDEDDSMSDYEPVVVSDRFSEPSVELYYEGEDDATQSEAEEKQRRSVFDRLGKLAVDVPSCQISDDNKLNRSLHRTNTLVEEGTGGSSSDTKSSRHLKKEELDSLLRAKLKAISTEEEEIVEVVDKSCDADDTDELLVTVSEYVASSERDSSLSQRTAYSPVTESDNSLKETSPMVHKPATPLSPEYPSHDRERSPSPQAHKRDYCPISHYRRFSPVPKSETRKVTAYKLSSNRSTVTKSASCLDSDVPRYRKERSPSPRARKPEYRYEEDQKDVRRSSMDRSSRSNQPENEQSSSQDKDYRRYVNRNTSPGPRWIEESGQTSHDQDYRKYRNPSPSALKGQGTPVQDERPYSPSEPSPASPEQSTYVETSHDVDYRTLKFETDTKTDRKVEAYSKVEDSNVDKTSALDDVDFGLAASVSRFVRRQRSKSGHSPASSTATSHRSRSRSPKSRSRHVSLPERDNDNLTTQGKLLKIALSDVRRNKPGKESNLEGYQDHSSSNKARDGRGDGDKRYHPYRRRRKAQEDAQEKEEIFKIYRSYRDLNDLMKCLTERMFRSRRTRPLTDIFQGPFPFRDPPRFKNHVFKRSTFKDLAKTRGRQLSEDDNVDRQYSAEDVTNLQQRRQLTAVLDQELTRGATPTPTPGPGGDAPPAPRGDFSTQFSVERSVYGEDENKNQTEKTLSGSQSLRPPISRSVTNPS